jgi:hypothetical protein
MDLKLLVGVDFTSFTIINFSINFLKLLKKFEKF